LQLEKEKVVTNRGELISSIRMAIEEIGTNKDFKLSDIVARIPDAHSRSKAIAHTLVKMSSRDEISIKLRAKGARRSSLYFWHGRWPKKKTVAERFWELVQKSEGCWVWQGNIDDDGYGRFGSKGTVKQAHRVSWEIINGPIPEDVCVLHKCDNPPCVRPDHLFLGDRGDNAKDMASKGRQYLQVHPEAALRGDSHWKRRKRSMSND
jgi:hypothetical protein